MRQYKPKPGAQEVLPLFPELPMPCAQGKPPAGPTSGGANRTDQCPKSGRHHGGVLVTVQQLAGGKFLLYQANDEWLMHVGLIKQHQLPSRIPGHTTVISKPDSFAQAVRMWDGNVALTIDAMAATELERPYLKFMAVTLEADALCGEFRHSNCPPSNERRAD